MTQDILIAPGSGEPYIKFIASGVNDTVSAVNLNIISGVSPVSGINAAGSGVTTLSFEGTQGQLFSISDNLSSGTIFSVSDVVGLPLIEVDASGDVKIGEFGRNVGIGSGILPAYQLDVFGTGNFRQGVRVNNLKIDGTEIDLSVGSLTIDVAANIELDSGSGIWILEDGGTEALRFTEGNSGDVTVKLATDGKDLIFTDNGDATNMKILDAAAGINVPGEVQTTKIAYTDGDDSITIANGGGVTFSTGVTFSAGFDVGSDAEGDMLYHNGTNYIRLAKGTDDYVLKMNGNVPNWESAGGGAGTMTTVKSNGSTVGDADIVTLDFSSDFGVSEDPNTEINITIGTLNQNTTGSAATLTTARAINGVNFDGSAAITVTAAGSTLSDTVTVAKGGTGATSLADKAVLITQDSGTDTVAAAVIDANGELLIGGTSGPAVATLTQGSNMTITNGDGTITLAAAGASPPSDKKLKKNIKKLDIKDIFEKLAQLQAVEFDWGEAAKELFAKEGHDFGYLAQDVEKIIPELVGEFGGYKNLEYGKLSVLLIDVVKQLKQEVNELKEEVGRLKKD